jgi:phosphoglycolate phosphatase
MVPLTIVFDLDGTLVDTAPDLIDTLNVVFAREGLPPVDYAAARNMIGGGARRMIENGLKLEGRPLSGAEIDRMFADFIAY